MKVLISWSGSRSKAVAETLRYWLKAVIQSIDPWMSEEDIEKGARWSTELARKLEETRVGLICLTPENLEAPWILFEAGALSKTLQKTYVCPFLFKMEKKDFKGPLSQFQAASADKEDTRKLLGTINKLLDTPLSEKQLEDAFRCWWPELEKRLRRIPDIEQVSERRVSMRGTSLGEEIARVGLVDIENRDDSQRELPPGKFYALVKREIAITGVSLYQTFHKHVDLIHNALGSGKKICAMILHPDSADVSWLSKREKRGIRHDIMATIETIKAEGVYQHPSFQIRFLQKLPPFIGVMIDGDIECHSGKEPADDDGQIRVQPNTVHVTGHRGLIVQLRKSKKTPDNPAGPFDYFAQDLRQQWSLDGKEDPNLFNIPKEVVAENARSKQTRSSPSKIIRKHSGTLKTTASIKILFLSANPSDTTRLRLDQEIRSIDESLRQSDYRDRFDVRPHLAVRVIDIQKYLLRHRPNIVHFSGHGNEANEIILEDNSGNSKPVSVRALSRLFSVLKDNIRCVVLNACYSEQQALAIAENIDCVIGMSKAIGDSAAINFATSFYQALGFGKNVKAAFDLGCAN